MDRFQKAYTDWLEGRNGFCNCKELKPLYTLEREVESLSERCDAFQGRFPEVIKPGEESELLHYGKIAGELDSRVKDFYAEMNLQIRGGNLALTLHDGYTTQKRLDLKEATRLLKKGAIITINCAKCNQQTELASLPD